MIVDGIGSSQSDQIGGTLSLVVTGAASTVSFESNASAFATLSVQATDGISITQNLSTSVGGITLDADTDANDHVGTLTITGAVSTSNDGISIQADDLALTGSLDSGTADVSLRDSDGTGIAVGSGASPMDWPLTSAELALITADQVAVTTSGNVSIATLAATTNIATALSFTSDGTTHRSRFRPAIRHSTRSN